MSLSTGPTARGVPSSECWWTGSPKECIICSYESPIVFSTGKVNYCCKTNKSPAIIAAQPHLKSLFHSMSNHRIPSLNLNLFDCVVFCVLNHKTRRRFSKKEGRIRFCVEFFFIPIPLHF